MFEPPDGQHKALPAAAFQETLKKLFALGPGRKFLLGFESVVECEIVAVQGEYVLISLPITSLQAVGVPEDLRE